MNKRLLTSVFIFGACGDNAPAPGTILATPVGASITTEGGGAAMVEVRLGAQPSNDVTIAVVTSNSQEGVATPATLTFTSANFAAPQVVRITGVDDAAPDGDQSYRLVLGPAVGGQYEGLSASVSLTNQDNDSAGITLLPATDSVTEEGAQSEFGVVLRSQPSADVTLALASDDEGEVVLGRASVTFTTANWNAPQQITITGVDDDLQDGNQEVEIAVTGITSTDATYAAAALPAPITVTNIDNDSAGFIVSSTSGDTTETGGQADFTVRLTTQPSADVVLSLSSTDAGEGVATPALLTFTSDNWNAPQTILVTGVDDAIQDGNQTYDIAFGPTTSADLDYAAIQPGPVTFTNLDDETAGIIVATMMADSSEAGDQATVLIVLQSEPTADVTIAFTTSDTTEGVGMGVVVFTPSDWNAPQIIVVTGQDDAVQDGNQPYQVDFAAATSSDPNYAGLVAMPAALLNIDNDSAGITVSDIDGDTTENGDQASFTVVLNSEPTDDVTVQVASDATDEGTLSVATLVFTNANWNAPQTVLVTGVDDAVADGNQPYQIDFDTTLSTDSNYQGVVPRSVDVVNVDNDSAGITILVEGATSELGDQALINVVLNSEPTSDVTVNFVSDDTTEGATSVTELVFTAANWNAPQQIIVTGQDDAVADGDQPYQVDFAATTSLDSNYAGIVPANVDLINVDDDSAGITAFVVNDTTTEGGGQAQFGVVLNSEPTADVIIQFVSDTTDEGTTDTTTLTFTATNWSAPQLVSVTGENDAVADGNQPYQIDFMAVTSTDADYASIVLGSLDFINLDDDSADIIVSAVSGPTTEGGDEATLTVVLASEPTADVTVTFATSDSTEGLSSPASLLFTSVNWNAPQTITITGVDDLVADGPQPYRLDFGATTSADGNYGGLVPASVDLSNIDDDSAGILVTAGSGTTSESGDSSSFEIVLNSEPTDAVTVNFASDDTGEGTTDVTFVTFTTFDWNLPRTITITGEDDDGDDGDQPYQIDFSSVVSTDPNYAGLSVASLDVTNEDNDTAGIRVTQISSTTSEGGGTASFEVTLDTEPTADVTVWFDTNAADEGTPDSTSLLFEAARWNAPLTVTVTGVDDALDDGDQAFRIDFMASTSTDPAYAGITPASLDFTNTDDDTASIVVGAVSGNTTEAGGTATFSVVLASQPTADVTINLATDDATEGTPGATALTFTAANWNTAQIVTVTGVDDAIDDGNVAYQIDFSATTSADPLYSGQIPASRDLTNVDDDDAVNCGVNLLKNSASGGTANVVSVSATGSYAVYRASFGTICNEAWFPFGTLCDEPATTDSQTASTKTDNNSGATWLTGGNTSGEGIMVIDLGAMSDFDRLQVYQMFSDGKTTSVRFATHAAAGATAPAANDAGWQLITAGFNNVAAGARAGNVVTGPTEFAVGARATRYLRVEGRNNGSLGFPNYLEIRSIKMFNTSCQGGCRGILAANPTAPSGTYTIGPPGVSAFNVYCDMTSDGGAWTKILQYTGGSYVMSAGGFGPISAAATTADAKLSDAQINAIRTLAGGTANYKIDGSLSALNAYVRSNGPYADLVDGFGLGRSAVHAVSACVASSFATCALTAANPIAWMDLLHYNTPSAGESCNRYFTGHLGGGVPRACWASQSTTERCVSGGASCGGYASHPDAVMWIQQ